jgi:hypothetical protein
MLAVGDRLIVANFASVPPTITSFKWDTAHTPPGRIFLSEAYVGDDANSDETGTTENNECSDRGVCNTDTGAFSI